MPRLIAAFLCAAMCCVYLSAAAQSTLRRTCSIQAKITDEDGVAIRAFVLVRSKRGALTNQTIPVNPGGQFKIGLAPGFYDLFVSAPGFQPMAQGVDLHACKPVTLNLTLFFDPDEHQDGGF